MGRYMDDTAVISEIVWRSVQRWGDRVALEDARDGRRLTYRELYVRMQSAASSLRARGYPPGSRVVIKMDGSPDWAVALLGALHADFVAVPIPAAIPAVSVAALIRHVEAVAVVAADVELPDGKSVPFGNSACDAIAMADLASMRPEYCTLPQASADDVAVLALTSGSTARPRAVPLTHRNLLSNVGALGSVRSTHECETLLSVLPPSHLFEMVAGQLAPLAMGARIVYAGAPLPNRLLDAIRDRHVTRVLLVPAFVEALVLAAVDEAFDRGVVDAMCPRRTAMDVARCLTAMTAGDRDRLTRAIRDRIGGALRSVGVGGAALAPVWVDLLTGSGIGVDVGYGLTEAGPLVSVGTARECPPGSVGRPLPGVDVRIDAGEILVRSPGVARTEHTRSQLTEDGWLRTGDRGRLDDNGYLFVTGRLKEAIVSADGGTVYPEDVEPHYASSLFGEWCVVPVSDLDGNDIATLIAVPRSPALTADEFDREVAALRARAPADCRVAGAIRRDAPLPRTALGKIARRALGASVSAVPPAVVTS